MCHLFGSFKKMATFATVKEITNTQVPEGQKIK